MPQLNVAYYTDEITLLSARTIWRISRQAQLLAPLVFGFFLLRKCLRLPFQAKYGSPRPTELHTVGIETLPAEARDAFAERFPALDASGYLLAFCTMMPFIGAKSGASAVFLSQTGESYATIVWLKIKLGKLERSDTIFACHSTLQTGGELTTASLPRDLWIPEMIPPETTVSLLPKGAPQHEVIRAHRERLASPQFKPNLLDAASLAEYLLSSTQRLYDHLINKNLYRRLTDAEVSRLVSASGKS